MPFVSLFSGAGIGDLGWRAAGFELLASCELERDRAALARRNFPEAAHFDADVSEVADELCGHVERRLSQACRELFLLSCTAPCQGMSKNGQGTLLNNARQGKRPQLDPRNRLILPALRVINRLQPMWIVFENVVEMQNTVIEDEHGKLRPILEVIRTSLGPSYFGAAHRVEFADYGVPQRRQRLITIYTRDANLRHSFDAGMALLPPRTHAQRATGRLKRWVSVEDALCDFPPLDAQTAEQARAPDVLFHRVPVLDPKKYEWIRHAPLGASAFDNQCVNPECGCDRNPAHGTGRGEDGINRANRDTPLHCMKCGHELPRPYVVGSDGQKRIMSGYTSAYKRMAPHLPAPTLTRNLSYACSDQKVHPRQNRVLSLAEAMTLQTISDYAYEWGPLEFADGKKTKRLPVASDGLIRLVIGESVPPRFLHLLGEHLKRLSGQARGVTLHQEPGGERSGDLEREQEQTLANAQTQLALW